MQQSLTVTAKSDSLETEAPCYVIVLQVPYSVVDAVRLKDYNLNLRYSFYITQ